jgi:hypothetical protein
MPTPCRPSDLLARPGGATGKDIVADEADLGFRLRLQHAHEIGIGHRRQWMVLHA